MEYIKKKPSLKPKSKQIKQLAKAAGASIDAQAASLCMHSKDKTREQSPDNDRENAEQYASSRVAETTQNGAKYIGEKSIRAARDALRHAQSQLNEEKTRQPTKRIWNDFQKRAPKHAMKLRKTFKSDAIKSVRAVKTTQKAVVKTTKASMRAAKAARKIAIEVAKATREAIQVAVKAGVATVKAITAIVKAIVAFIASVGWPAVLIIVVIVAIGAVLASPYGIVFDDEDENTPSIQDMVAKLEDELEKRIEEIILDVNPDETVIEYAGNADNEGSDNWKDVLAIYAVKTTMLDRLDVMVIDDSKQNKLREVFWNMNVLGYHTEIEKVTTTITDQNGEEKEVSYSRTILHITIDVKDYKKMFSEYGFVGDQIKMTEELLDSEEFNILIGSLVEQTRTLDLTPSEITAIQSNLPPNENSTAVINFAISKLGTPYSRMDCSKYVQLCYQQIGVELPRTAAAQAKYCVDNKCLIAKADLRQGDLIFFSHRDKETGEFNDRYLSVSHVAIYVGNGMMIDSSSSNGKVVYRELIGGQVLYGNPQ